VTNSATNQNRIAAIINGFDNDPATKSLVFELVKLGMQEAFRHEYETGGIAALRDELKGTQAPDLDSELQPTIDALSAVIKLAKEETTNA
jgi:hypothetical protein